MAAWVARNGGPRPADEQAIGAEIQRAEHPFTEKPGDINHLRERLLDTMWDDVGILRDGVGLQRGLDTLHALEAELMACGVADGDRAFNLTWHDWLNMRSLLDASKAIALAASKRTNSRGAHYREDFPDEGDLASSTFTVARQRGGRIEITEEPVQFTIVRPGATLLDDDKSATTAAAE
jgi:fumarate reductase flavoprotein subunit